MFKNSELFIILFLSNFLFTSNLFGNDFLSQKIEDFILKNPEIILKSLENYQKKVESLKINKEKEFLKKNISEIINDPLSYKEGNENSTIVFINFIDYNCIYCKKANRDVVDILENYKDIRYVVKEFPILGDQSLAVSKMVLSVLIENGPYVYKKLHQEILRSKEKITKQKVKDILKRYGFYFNETKAKKNNEIIEKHLKYNFFIANNLGISGTPTYIIGNEILWGYVEKSVLAKVIESNKNR